MGLPVQSVKHVTNVEVTSIYHALLVADQGRQPATICMLRKKMNISIVMAGQRLGIKEVDDGIWPVSFMRYDVGYIDMEQRTL